MPITVQYYETTGVAMIALYWESTNSQAKQIIPSSALYYKQSEVPITGDAYMIAAEDVPTAPTNLAQDGPATYDHTSLTLTWSAPVDTGCLAVLGYKYQYKGATASSSPLTWTDAPHTTMNGANTGGTISQLVAGEPIKLRIVARNHLGYGTPSKEITLTPAKKPSAPGPVLVPPEPHAYGGDYLVLTWTAPTDTGANDNTKIALTKYMLEVDEQFGLGFVPLVEFDASIDGPFSATMTYTHTNLILGHPYQYRVKAENLMGYGAYSAPSPDSPHGYIPRSAPGKPPSAPKLVPEHSTRTEIVISPDPIIDNTGGSAITGYNVYVDDGNDGPFGGPYPATAESTPSPPGPPGTTWRFSTAALPIAPTTGKIYKFKYSAVNVAGESPLSDELSVLLAEVPTAPQGLRRIDSATLPAG